MFEIDLTKSQDKNYDYHKLEYIEEDEYICSYGNCNNKKENNNNNKNNKKENNNKKEKDENNSTIFDEYIEDDERFVWSFNNNDINNMKDNIEKMTIYFYDKMCICLCYVREKILLFISYMKEKYDKYKENQELNSESNYYYAMEDNRNLESFNKIDNSNKKRKINNYVQVKVNENTNIDNSYYF